MTTELPISDEFAKELTAGVKLLGRQLCKWADYAALAELTATLDTADGQVYLRVARDRRYWIDNQDITRLLQ